MIRFWRYFWHEWREYPLFMWFCSTRQKQLEELKEQGEWFPKNRFDYAWVNAKIRWKHRDRYSRKCTGDCEHCRLKHC